ncbi:MAG: SGNH/GDSL hydrolase family protein [Actinomycetales bacterium]
MSVGDSFTEGMEDLYPHARESAGLSGARRGNRVGGYRGWADRLAASLAVRSVDPQRFGYANVAVRGRKLADIVGPQLDRALALEPDLVTIVGGGNDILRPRVEVDELAVALDRAVGRIRTTGADVLLATPVCPQEAPVIRWTTGRVGQYAAHINSIARRHGAYVIDQWGMPVLRSPRVWAPDRIHLTSQGHEIVTLLALVALGVLPPDGSGAGVDAIDQWDAATDRDDSLDSAGSSAEALAERCTRIAARGAHVDVGVAADLAWAREFAGPWVNRRLRGRSSGDAVLAKRPELNSVTPRS